MLVLAPSIGVTDQLAPRPSRWQHEALAIVVALGLVERYPSTVTVIIEGFVETYDVRG